MRRNKPVLYNPLTIVSMSHVFQRLVCADDIVDFAWPSYLLLKMITIKTFIKFQQNKPISSFVFKFNFT